MGKQRQRARESGPPAAAIEAMPANMPAIVVPDVAMPFERGLLERAEEQAQMLASGLMPPEAANLKLQLVARVAECLRWRKLLGLKKDHVEALLDMAAPDAVIALHDMALGTRAADSAVVNACREIIGRAPIGAASRREVKVSGEVSVDADRYRRLLDRRARAAQPGDTAPGQGQVLDIPVAEAV